MSLFAESFRVRQRKNIHNRASPYTRHRGLVSNCVWSAEVRDKRAWAEMTLPGARLGRKKQPNAESRKEIRKVKKLFPMKVLKHNVKNCELRDYRVKAEKLTPKGDYFGMRNFDRLLSIANYYGQHWKHGYPEKRKTMSLNELVEALDFGDDVDLVDGSVPLSSRSEPGIRKKSDSDLKQYTSKTTDDIKTKAGFLPKHTRALSVVSERSKWIWCETI